MKNLILTFVFALVSLISFTQTLSVTYVGDVTGVIHATPDTLETLELDLSDSVVFSTGGYFSCKINNDLVGNNINEVTFKDYAAGIYIVRLTTVAPYCFKIIVSDHSTASTSENTLTREELKAYPSPATSDIKISFQADKSDMVVNIFSLNGQLVYQDDAQREVGMVNVLELNVSDWASGVYLVNNGKETFKFVVL